MSKKTPAPSFPPSETDTDDLKAKRDRRPSLWKSVSSFFNKKQHEENGPALSKSDTTKTEPIYDLANYEGSESDVLEHSSIRSRQTYDNSRVINYGGRTGFYDNLNLDGDVISQFGSSSSDPIYDRADNVSERTIIYDRADNIFTPEEPLYDLASNNPKIAKWLEGNLEEPRSMRFQIILSSLNKSQHKRFQQIITSLIATTLNLGIDVSSIDEVLHNRLIYQIVVKHEEKIRSRLTKIDSLNEEDAIELLTQAAVCYFILDDFHNLSQVTSQLNNTIEYIKESSYQSSSTRDPEAYSVTPFPYEYRGRAKPAASAEAESSASTATAAALQSKNPGRRPPTGKPYVPDLGGLPFPEKGSVRQKIYVPETTAKASLGGVSVTEVVKTLFEVYKKGEDKIDQNIINRTKKWLNENGINTSLDSLIQSIERTSKLFTRDVYYDSHGIARVGETDQRLIDCIMHAAKNIPNTSVDIKSSKSKESDKKTGEPVKFKGRKGDLNFF